MRHEMITLRVATGILSFSFAGHLAAGSAPTAVSPGDRHNIIAIASRCPQFSWVASKGETVHELVVFKISETEPVASIGHAPILQKIMDTGTFSWRPRFQQCLQPGSSYAWSIGELQRSGTSSWSEPMLFHVLKEPKNLDLSQAIAEIRHNLSTTPKRTSTKQILTEEDESYARGLDIEDNENSEVLAGALNSFSVNSSGNVQGTSFAGDGSGLTNVAASDLACNTCVAQAELDFDPATQSELNAHGVITTAHHSPPSSLPPSGPAGGDLQGFYPSPTLRDSSAVLALKGLTGVISLQEGAGIDIITSGQTITIENDGLPTTRSWHFNVQNLAPVQLGAGGPGTLSGADLDVNIPVYFFNELNPGSTFTSGVTSLPTSSELRGLTPLEMKLYWVVDQDGGDVKWRVQYSARRAGNLLNDDGVVEVITPVDNTGADRVYRSVISIFPGFSSSDDVLGFSLGRQSFTDTSTGNVGLLAIRFVYDAEL